MILEELDKLEMENKKLRKVVDAAREYRRAARELSNAPLNCPDDLLDSIRDRVFEYRDVMEEALFDLEYEFKYEPCAKTSK